MKKFRLSPYNIKIVVFVLLKVVTTIFFLLYLDKKIFNIKPRYLSILQLLRGVFFTRHHFIYSS